jgi:hypothetical protein
MKRQGRDCKRVGNSAGEKMCIKVRVAEKRLQRDARPGAIVNIADAGDAVAGCAVFRQ